MRRKTCFLLMSLAFAYGFVFMHNAYSSSGHNGKENRYYARRGSDDHGDDHGDDHHHQRSYKYYRHYPSDFFFYKKIYFYPQKRYYYYYDIYPQKIYYYDWEREELPSNPEYLPITSIANMGSQGVPEAVIIAEIERTRSEYKLTSEVITYLKQNNVGDRVIDFMLETGKKQ